MHARLVTAYVPLVGHPRPASEYGKLGEHLSAVPVRKKAFYQRVEDTWMHKYVQALPFYPSIAYADNPTKNTFAYHCVQHEKLDWLSRAADEDPDADVVVWVDYGIFHQPRHNDEAIIRFMQGVDDRYIYAPGCWESVGDIARDVPCWRFCGSVLAVPTKYVAALAREVKATAVRRILETKHVEWEVNTWARVENTSTLPWHWYAADHDVSQFENLPCLEKSNA